MAERSIFSEAIDGHGEPDNPYEINGVAINGWYYKHVYGFFLHCVNGVTHSDDAHAMASVTGTTFWFANGLPHRFDGPVLEGVDGTKMWYRYGVLHRLEGPASILPDGTTPWLVDGKVIDVQAIFRYVPVIHLTEGEQMILRLRV